MSEKKRDYVLFLEDILESITRIEEYSKDIDLNRLHKHRMAVDAIVRNFEIIGEAVKNIPRAVRSKYPDVEWKEAAGFRDILIHEYFGIDLEAVRDTISKNLPAFKRHIRKVLREERKESK
jgi:uncharacterized protein with HEPN domain